MASAEALLRRGCDVEPGGLRDRRQRVHRGDKHLIVTRRRGSAVAEEGVCESDEVLSLELDPQPPRTATRSSATAMAEGRRIATQGS